MAPRSAARRICLCRQIDPGGDAGGGGDASRPAAAPARHQRENRQADDGAGREMKSASWPDFFGMTSGAGGWRVAIVDTADEMNDNAANALLKLLEEPPSRAMLMLLSNTPGKLLPTIRSRCQRLVLRPLDERALIAGAGKIPARSWAEMPNAPSWRACRVAQSAPRWRWRRRRGPRTGRRSRPPDRECRCSPIWSALLALGDRLFRINDGLEQSRRLSDRGAVGPHPCPRRIRARRIWSAGFWRWPG